MNSFLIYAATTLLRSSLKPSPSLSSGGRRGRVRMVNLLPLRHQLEIHPSGAETYLTRAYLGGRWRRVIVLCRPGCPHGCCPGEVIVGIANVGSRAPVIVPIARRWRRTLR